MKQFKQEVSKCEATFTESTRYEGGVEFEHGLEEGSRPCSCGHGRHFVCRVTGEVVPSVFDA